MVPYILSRNLRRENPNKKTFQALFLSRDHVVKLQKHDNPPRSLEMY
jgi:hypothetical protein